jgi:hypothetical protein
MHFGLYLHRKGIISAEQLVAALEAQLKHLVPIGQLALEEGLLSAHDIFDILRAQHDSPHERFGELAMEMGLLRRENLMRLLMIQSERKLPLSEILVRQGVLSKCQADSELNAFRRQQSQPRSSATTMTVIRPRRERSAGRAPVDPILAF